MFVRLTVLVCLLVHTSVADTNLGVGVAIHVSETVRSQEILDQELKFVGKLWSYITKSKHVDLSNLDIELVLFPFNADVDYSNKVVYDSSDIVDGSEMPDQLVQDITSIAASNVTGLANIPAVVASIIENPPFESLPTDPEERQIVIFIVSDFISSQDHDQLKASLEEAATDKIAAVAVALDKTRDDNLIELFHEKIDLRKKLTANEFKHHMHMVVQGSIISGGSSGGSSGSSSSGSSSSGSSSSSSSSSSSGSSSGSSSDEDDAK